MVIDMRDIHKSFGPNQVLSGVNITLFPGEVHALMGENGAGKSTLMNILTGTYSANSGTITIDGEPRLFNSPIEAERAGVTFIHQEMNTWQDMTVLENLFVNKELTNGLGLLDIKAMRHQAHQIFERLGVMIDLDVPARDLSVGNQQMIEIAKALMTDARVLIMDEPTAALTERETEKLFKVIEDLRTKQVAIVYISHRMEEIFRLSDKITVMRDGQTIDTKNTAATHLDEVVQKLVGREINDYYPKRVTRPSEKTVLKVSGLQQKQRFYNIDFELKEGEVLGFFGLMGSGRTEVMRAVYGLDRIDKGTVSIGDAYLKITPKLAKKHGMGFVTENRKNEGLHLDFSIRDNISLPNISELGLIINKKKEKTYTDDLISLLTVKTANPLNPVSSLSGGNQQKVVIAKWIGLQPKILILDEPTRGIDVGAKQEIYKLINKLVADGVSVIVVSSELPEVMGVSDRIVVMHDGTIAKIVDKVATREEIMALATGGGN